MSAASTPATISRVADNTERPGAGMRLLRAGVLAVFRKGLCVPHVIGHEHIPAGPFVLCANHRSHLDSLALICGLRLEHRCALLAARDYFEEGGTARRLLAWPFTVIPVERRQPGVAMLGTIAAAAAFFRHGGQALIAYPEGTRQTGPAIAPFKRGAATLALALGRPVLPVFIDGTERLLPKGRHIPMRGLVTLTLGPAIQPSTRPGAGQWHDRSRELIRSIEASVRELARGGAA
jgi:1-acyl-sn-glycerol-3-phosphate acyltransferase